MHQGYWRLYIDEDYVYNGIFFVWWKLSYFTYLEHYNPRMQIYRYSSVSHTKKDRAPRMRKRGIGSVFVCVSTAIQLLKDKCKGFYSR